MTGMSELDINLENLSGNALVNDIVYSPLITGLLNKARESGNPVVTGIGMLLHQARPAFKEWFGITPEVTEDLRKKVLQC
jgi:shikimate dehydrogenase